MRSQLTMMSKHTKRSESRGHRHTILVYELWFWPVTSYTNCHQRHMTSISAVQLFQISLTVEDRGVSTKNARDKATTRQKMLIFLIVSDKKSMFDSGLQNIVNYQNRFLVFTSIWLEAAARLYWGPVEAALSLVWGCCLMHDYMSHNILIEWILREFTGSSQNDQNVKKKPSRSFWVNYREYICFQIISSR